METMTRRRVMARTGVAITGAALLGTAASGDEPGVATLWPLEGELKVHPKYLYRYYLLLGNGQTCALYGADHGREPESLSRIPLPARVRVRGILGTEHHPGGTDENLSPFPKTWFVYLDVHEAQILK